MSIKRILIARKASSLPKAEIKQKLVALGLGWRVVSYAITLIVEKQVPQRKKKYTAGKNPAMDWEEFKKQILQSPNNLGVKIIHILERMGVNSLRRLEECTAHNLLIKRQFGLDCLKELRQALSMMNTHLKNDK